MKMLIRICSILYLLLGQKTLASEKDLYDFHWLDPDKKVFVLQNKLHQKYHSFYFNGGPGMGLSSNFQDTSLWHIDTGFYFSEEWAFEVNYNKYSNKDNDAYSNLKKLNGSVPFIRNPLESYSAMIKWEPFYGKINTFNKIIYFDWSFALGLGQLEMESNANTVSNSTTANTFNQEKYNTIAAKTNFQFHINKNMHVNLGIQMDNYKAPGPKINNQPGQDKFRTNTDTTLSLGFSY